MDVKGSKNVATFPMCNNTNFPLPIFLSTKRPVSLIFHTFIFHPFLLIQLYFCRAAFSSLLWNIEMTEVPVLDFSLSDRSGRRNALPDILGSPVGVNPTDMSLKLAELSLTGQFSNHV